MLSLINQSVCELVGNVADIEGSLVRKLRTALGVTPEIVSPPFTMVTEDAVTLDIIPDAEWKLTSVTDSSVTFTSISDENGLVTFVEIPPGVYTLELTSVPDGYRSPTDRYEVTVDPLGNATIVRTPEEGEAEPPKNADGYELYLYPINCLICLFESSEASGAPVAGMTYQLLDDTGAFLQEEISDANGRMLFQDLEPGDYILEMVSGMVGPFVDPSTYHVHVTDGCAVTVTVEQPPEWEILTRMNSD